PSTATIIISGKIFSFLVFLAIYCLLSAKIPHQPKFSPPTLSSARLNHSLNFSHLSGLAQIKK
ncbi:MAG: hypothetical protein ACYSTT_17535, partial [Planctomycetota bacterium]